MLLDILADFISDHFHRTFILAHFHQRGDSLQIAKRQGTRSFSRNVEIAGTYVTLLLPGIAKV